MRRKEFLQISSPIFLLLANGNISKALNQGDEWFKKQKLLRFAIASDIHYGQDKTDYDIFFKTAIEKINMAHAQTSFDFCMLNGDIIHNDPKYYPAAKAHIEQLKMPWYVTPGNHDMVTADEWQQIWNSPVNYDFKIGDVVFLAGTTSNEKGEYICPDMKWFSQKLEAHKSVKIVFIIIHINPAKLTTYGIDCPDFIKLVKQYKNVRAVFNGHDHDEDGIKMHEGIPFVFDSHVGSSWGTNYKGFRVVEVLKNNDALTYMMNPAKKINETRL